MNYQKTYMNHIHSSSLLYQLATMWKTQTLCDAIIRTGSVITKAHRVVLVAACPMLQSMENAAAGSHLEVRLAADIKQDSVNTFLQYLYEGFMTLNEDNYKDIEKISRLLQVENAIKCCADFIKCISTSSANQYRYNYPDQLEFKHVRTTELQKVHDRHPKRGTDRPISPGTKRPRFQRQSSPMSDSRTHDMSGMKESYTVNDPWDRVPRLGSHSSTPTSVHVPSQQPGVIDIIEDSIELLQTEPPGKRPGDDGRELRKVQSTVGVSVASQRDAPADVQIVNVPGATDIPSQKTASESTTFIPSSPSSSDSSSQKERPPHYSNQNFQPKPDLEKSTSNLPDLSSDVEISAPRPRPPETVVASPSTQPYPVAMTASSRSVPPTFQQKSFAAGSAMQAESLSPSTVQRSSKPHTISRVESTEKSSPMERSQDSGFQARDQNRLSPDISIVKVENEVGAEETGMLDMYVANAGGGVAGPTHGQNEEEQSDFDVEEPPGDLQRDELSNESGNLSMDQSGNWYMGNFRVIGENVLSGDPANLMFEIPVDSEEQIGSHIPTKEITDIVWNTNECEWKITSAYTLSQTPFTEYVEEKGKMEGNVEYEKLQSAANKTKPEKIQSRSKRVQNSKRSMRKIKNITLNISSSDTAGKGVNLKTQRGSSTVPQKISASKANSSEKQAKKLNKYNNSQLQHEKSAFQNSQLKGQSGKSRGISTKRSTATSTVSKKSPTNYSQKMKSQDKIVKPKIRQGLYRYDFRTFKRNGKRSTKTKESMPLISFSKVSKINEPSSVKTRKSHPKTTDLNTQLVQSDLNVEYVQHQLNTKDIQTDFDENESTMSEPAIDTTMKTATENREEIAKPKIGIHIAYPSHCLAYQERKGKCTYCQNNPDMEKKIEPINTKCKICNVYLCKSIWRKGGRSCFERYHKERAKIITESVVGHPPNKEEIMSAHYPVNISIQEDSRRKKVCEICYAEKTRKKDQGSTLSGCKCSICTVGLCAKYKDCFQTYHNKLFEMNQYS
ncbi:uncharacterized protein LOC133186776 isoform X1 [Saccostrea echinata]|uniref:uncharacterized protein LOC133186776 isoform X1 n=1 Tax=Saccostrea echinata TaxID=191078 RepID=UPI002A81F6AC|nr:uncharacterized protein LOC133186776 isoform X1 [Saccostrea echinata]